MERNLSQIHGDQGAAPDVAAAGQAPDSRHHVSCGGKIIHGEIDVVRAQEIGVPSEEVDPDESGLTSRGHRTRSMRLVGPRGKPGTRG
jgi:hypothetical protein